MRVLGGQQVPAAITICLLVFVDVTVAFTTTTPCLFLQPPTTATTALFNRKNRRYMDEKDEYWDDDEYYEDDDYVDSLGDFKSRSGLDVPSSYGRRDGWRLPESVSKALLAGVFVLGVGLGVTVDSQVNTNPKDLASRDAIDNAAPNPTLCAKLGASAMAFDQVSGNIVVVFLQMVVCLLTMCVAHKQR